MPNAAPPPPHHDSEESRRSFLEKCGRYAVVTPPAITMMLAVASTPTDAVASGFESGPIGRWTGAQQIRNELKSRKIALSVRRRLGHLRRQQAQAAFKNRRGG